MSNVLIAGVAVLDFVFSIQEFPKHPEKYRADDADIVNGGNAANAAIAVSRLGGSALLATRLGDDVIADLIISGLEREGIDCTLVRKFAGHRSSFSSIYLDALGERQIVNYRDTSLSMDAKWLINSLPSNFDAALGDNRWPHGAKAIMEAAKKRGVPGIMDVEMPIDEGEEAVRLASHVAFSSRAAMEFTNTADVESAVHAAQAKLPGRIYVTDGKHGVFCSENGTIVHHAGFAVETIDTLGAGDVWHGAFALQLAEGIEDTAAIRFANAAAAIKCTRTGGGSGAPTRCEVEEFLTQNA